MLYRFSTTREIHESASRFQAEVVTALLTSTAAIEREYASDRDCRETGGYSIVVETTEDLSALHEIVNIDTHPCEWATRLGASGFVSALYVINNNLTIMLCIPECIAPPIIMDEL